MLRIAISITIVWGCLAFESDYHCSDKKICCYYPCDKLYLSHDHSEIGQEGNCGFGCTDGLVPDLNGVVHTQLYFMHDYYWADHNIYDYYDEDGPMKIEGSDKNMFDRCFDQCFPGATRRPTTLPTPKGPTPLPTPQLPTPAPNSCLIECGKSRCAEEMPRFLFAGQSNMEGHTEEARQGLFQELVNTVTSKESKAVKLSKMEDYIMAAQESTLGSSKAEAKGVYRLRKIIKKNNFIKKPYKKAVCSWTNPADSTKLDCERPVSPTARCGDNYGPELMFAHVFPTRKSPLKKKRIGITKVAQGGTEIYRHWMKINDGEQENFWQTLVDAITASKGSIEGFVWFQGENDSFETWNKENYLDNLSTFIGDVRDKIHKTSSKFKSPADVPVIIVELGNWIYLDIDQTVINAQRTFVENTENTVLVKSGVHKNPNKRLSKFYHFNAASQLIIGQRIAKAMAKLLKDA